MIPGQGVRLNGGSDLCSGRVEVLRGSAWNTVCDAGIDQQDAEVVCWQLQYGIPQEVLGAVRFGKGQGPVWSQEIQCRGNEPGLHGCPTSSREQPSCTHANDVGLVCVGYKLVNGSDSCSGRVELRHEGVWGTVCDRYWDLQDATVLCQQLNCGYAVAVLGQAHFGQGSGQIWADKFNCEGSEADLFKCPASEYGRGDCTHENDAGVISTGRVRLAAGLSRCEGRVEVYYNSAWGRVLHDSWGTTEASVVCRELDCGSAMEVSNSSRYGTGDSDVSLVGIRCTGDESYLINCSLPQQVSCSTNHTALRLVGGGGACAGRVEVYHNGSWGTVCDESWDLADAEVVCKQLQCGTALNASVSASFGQGTGPIWLDELRCQGNESTLWECASGGWGQHNCRHKEDAGVVCSVKEKPSVTSIPKSYSEDLNQEHCSEASPSRLPPQRDMIIPVIACIVLGALLFVVLVLLAGQLQHNRMLRREIAEEEFYPFNEAVYEEIEYKLARQGTYDAPRRGSFLSDELPSDYSDVEDSEGNPIPGESMPSLEGETPGYYDDAVPMNSNPEDLSGEFLQTSPVEEPCTKPSLGESKSQDCATSPAMPIEQESPSNPVCSPSSSPNDACHLPTEGTGTSNPLRGPSSSPIDACHLPTARTGNREPVQGPCSSPKDTCHISTTRGGQNDPVRGPSSSPNDTCHLPIVRRGTSDPMRDTSSSPNNTCHLPTTRTGSQQLSNRCLPPYHRTQGHQRPRARSQQLARRYLPPSH
ncbi:UNVERIFIED_CONTAM: hypothetical protein FKN15_059964 [Acipenser sinensis]